jgi:aspartate carbamoyltransferase catalytic subunit
VKSLLGIEGLGVDELTALIDSTLRYATVSSSATELDGSTMGSLFFEASTRTRLSFELAAQRLGARVMTFVPEHSSMAKGETLRDTVLTVSAIGADILVVRHGTEGVPAEVHEWTGRPVINAGDGSHEHPTQAIADCATLVERFGSVDGLEVAVVGDILHSRVAGSLLHALPALGARVTLVGPPSLLPGPGENDLDSLVGDVDVVYLLRVQRERGAGVEPDYTDRYQLNEERASRMRPQAVVMHPGPINRGVEITDQVADGQRALILRQVSNGTPARMAALAAVAGGPR